MSAGPVSKDRCIEQQTPRAQSPGVPVGAPSQPLADLTASGAPSGRSPDVKTQTPHCLESALEEKLEFLAGRINFETTDSPSRKTPEFKLGRMLRLLELCGNPHQGLACVHVAGTKGKGSSSTMIAQGLIAGGWTTGLYTSPHVHTIHERFSFQGTIVTDQELLPLLEIAQNAALQMDNEQKDWGGPTYFELATLIAFLHFSSKRADVAVMEVGMGGRLDSTNVCEPVVSVVTSISLDHTKQLGATTDLIAREKAGIFKPGIPVVSGVLDDAARRVIEQTAQNLGCPIFQLGKDFSVRGNFYDHPAFPSLTYQPHRRECGLPAQMTLSMAGAHQTFNAGVALATLGLLQSVGPKELSWQNVISGVSQAACPARFQVLQGAKPAVVLDVAHNPASVQAFVEELQRQFKGYRKKVVFACSKDKDAPSMLRILAPVIDQFVFTRFMGNQRAMAPEELARIGKELGIRQYLLAENPQDAWRIAAGEPQACIPAEGRLGCPDGRPGSANPEGDVNDQPPWVICVVGSFFLVAEIGTLISAKG